jgi:hypothetical protein
VITAETWKVDVAVQLFVPTGTANKLTLCGTPDWVNPIGKLTSPVGTP